MSCQKSSKSRVFAIFVTKICSFVVVIGVRVHLVMASIKINSIKYKLCKYVLTKTWKTHFCAFPIESTGWFAMTLPPVPLTLTLWPHLIFFQNRRGGTSLQTPPKARYYNVDFYIKTQSKAGSLAHLHTLQPLNILWFLHKKMLTKWLHLESIFWNVSKPEGGGTSHIPPKTPPWSEKNYNID